MLPQYTPKTTVRHPTISEVDDSNPPFASNWNPGVQGLADNEGYEYARSHHPGLDWRMPWVASSLDSTGTTNFLGAGWDPNTSRWLFVIYEDVAGSFQPLVYESWGDDGKGVQIGGGTFVAGPDTGGSAGVDCAAVCADGATVGGAWAAARLHNAATLTIATTPEASGGTWTVKRTVTGTPALNYMVAMASLSSGAIIYVTGGPLAGANVISGSTNSGGTWTDTALLGSLGIGQNPYWLIASSGTMALVVPAFWTPPGGNGLAWQSTDGVTWSSNAMTFQGAHDQVVGLVWQPLAQLWILALQTAVLTSPATCAFYSSPDGITWTKIANGPGKTLIADLGTMANGLVCTLSDATDRSSGMIFSPDLGVTWYASQFPMTDNAVNPSTGYTRSRLISSATGLAWHNSKIARFSPLAGLPPSALP